MPDDFTEESHASSPATVLEGETPSGHMSFAHDRLSLQLLPDQAGMVGYLAPKYVLSDRGTYFVNGAFRKTAEEQLSRAHHLYQHWPDLTIGKHSAAEEDRTGFRVTVQLNEAKQLGADVMSDYRFGIPYGWSIGFDPVRDRTGTEEEDARIDRTGTPHLKSVPVTELRAITEVRWWEGSTVTWGAIHNAGPDTIQRRRTVTRADLSLLLAAVKDGRLTAEQERQLAQLVDAWQTRAGAGTDHSTPPAPSQDQLAAELGMILDFGLYDGVAA